VVTGPDFDPDLDPDFDFDLDAPAAVSKVVIRKPLAPSI
jgi:hypothetical protein